MRWAIPLLSATLTIVGSVIAFKLTESLSDSQSWAIVGAWMAAGIIVTYLLSRLQARSQEESPEAIKERVSQLEPELRKQVQARSYGARSKLIEAPLRELDLDITPRLGWVRDPRLAEPEPISEKIADDIVAAFESSKRRLLIVGEPGSGKTMAAYSLIEYLDEREGAEGRIPLLVNLSAWEAQENFEAFLVDYLCSSVGYQVRQRYVANAFISSRRYSLILDGLDEIPAGLRAHFSERLDEFVRGLPSEVGVVVTCRSQEYEELLAAHPTGLGLVQAVEILPLTDQQLDSAFVELDKRDKDWELFLSQRHLTAYRRVRDLLSNPLFLNLAVVSHLSPGQLLDWTTTEQELREIVLDRYLDRTLADQRQYEPADARRYVAWIARFLNGAEVSPFGLKTSDSTVFDFANLTPPDPPRRYRLFEGLLLGLVLGLVFGEPLWELLWGQVFVGFNQPGAPPLWERRLLWGLVFFGLDLVLVFVGLGLVLVWELGWSLLKPRSALITSHTPKEISSRSLIAALAYGLVLGLVFGLLWEQLLGLVLGLASDTNIIVGQFFQQRIFRPSYGLTLWLFFGLLVGLLGVSHGSSTAISTHQTLSWPPTRQQGRGFLRGLVLGLGSGLLFGLLFGLGSGLLFGLLSDLFFGLLFGLLLGLTLGLLWGVVEGLLKPRSTLITSRTPKEISSRSLIAALTYGLVWGLILGLLWELVLALVFESVFRPLLGLLFGLLFGLLLGLRNGGWFVMLQRVAHRRLARAGNLPSRPYDFLEWGIERQIFRRVGGGVRFRHNLIQQHLAKSQQQQ